MDFVDYVIERALILIPALNIIGLIIKHTQFLEDRFIPVILLAFGVGGAIALMGLNVDAVIQGILVTGVAVFNHQLVKQMNK